MHFTQAVIYVICFFQDSAAHPKERSSPRNTADAQGARGGGRVCRLDHRAALGVGTASASRGTQSGVESGNEFVTMVLHDHNFVHHLFVTDFGSGIQVSRLMSVNTFYSGFVWLSRLNMSSSLAHCCRRAH